MCCGNDVDFPEVNFGRYVEFTSVLLKMIHNSLRSLVEIMRNFLRCVVVRFI